jgi:hypothetical protein
MELEAFIISFLNDYRFNYFYVIGLIPFWEMASTVFTAEATRSMK